MARSPRSAAFAVLLLICAAAAAAPAAAGKGKGKDISKKGAERAAAAAHERPPPAAAGTRPPSPRARRPPPPAEAKQIVALFEKYPQLLDVVRPAVRAMEWHDQKNGGKRGLLQDGNSTLTMTYRDGVASADVSGDNSGCSNLGCNYPAVACCTAAATPGGQPTCYGSYGSGCCTGLLCSGTCTPSELVYTCNSLTNLCSGDCTELQANNYNCTTEVYTCVA